jgi:uncharacterized membrane protein
VNVNVFADPLEKLLSALLYYGTCLASLVVALGLLVAIPSAAAGTRIAALGLGLFILLPVARVGTMLAFFLWSRDYRFGAIAALVLGIVFFSYLAGAR